MRSMKGLMLKDLLNLNHYKTTLVATIVIFGFITISQKNLAGVLPAMIIMMIGMIALSTFSYDEIAKTDKFILTLPTSRTEVVKAKYFLIIFLTIIGALIAFILNIMISYFFLKQTPNLLNYLLTCTGGVFGVAIIESIQIPSIYKWGVEKGKIQMFIVFAIIMGLTGGIVFISKNINLNFDMDYINEILTIFGIPMLIFVTAVMYYISYKISTKIYIKKEI